MLSFKVAERSLIEDQARASGAGLPAGLVAKLVEALDGGDQALTEVGGIQQRTCQTGSQAAQEGFLLKRSQCAIRLGEQGGQQAAQAGVGRLLGEAVTAGRAPTSGAAPRTNSGRGLPACADDQLLGAQVGEVVAYVGGGDLQGGAELGGGGVGMGGEIFQDALASGFYQPNPPGPPSQEGGKFFVIGV
jgi:hypothetical protein